MIRAIEKAAAAEDDKPSRSEMIRRIVTDWLRERGYLPNEDALVTEDDQRTSDIGLFNYANSYHAAADALQTTQLRATHPSAPGEFLYYHAIELYVKAYLRLSGSTPRELRKLGHKAGKLKQAFVAKGGWLADEDIKVLDLMTRSNVMRSRYIETGPFHTVALEALARTCDSLQKTVRSAMKAAGRTVR